MQLNEKKKNKFYKRDKELHARKSSRKNNLEGLFNRAMEVSDSLVSTVSLKTWIQKQQLKKHKLPSKVLSSLYAPSVSIRNVELVEANRRSF